jgi:predicted porin
MRRFAVAVAITAASALASAQSVTIFGVLDVGVSHYKNGSSSLTAVSNSGTTINRFGFRGEEDLGGGAKASFWLEAPITIDDGGASSGFSFSRRSTVSLSGPWGELRLGRDFTPTYFNDWFDPFGATGVGTHAASLLRMSSTAAGRAPFTSTFGANDPTYFRTSNSLGYFLPDTLGGLYGQAQYALDEQASGAGHQGRYAGARIGYRQGPMNMALAAGKVDGATPATAAAPDVMSVNAGGSWRFGWGSLMGEYSHETYRSAAARNTSQGFVAGVVVPVGTGEFKAAVSRVRVDLTDDPTATHMAIGYVHHLSKRTALYATAAHIANRNGAMLSVSGSLAGGRNQSSNGIDFGIRHSL